MRPIEKKLNAGKRVSVKSLPTIRQILLSFLQHDEKLCETAAEILDNATEDSYLQEILHVEPQWIIECLNTDSLVSGSWGLKHFVLDRTCFIYHSPLFGCGDENEALPILAKWEVSKGRRVARQKFLSAYQLCWQDYGLPPFMGQWAHDPMNVLAAAIKTILDATPKEWSAVRERIHERLASDPELLDNLSRKVAKKIQSDSEIIHALVTHFLSFRDVKNFNNHFKENEQEQIIETYVTLLGIPYSRCREQL